MTYFYSKVREFYNPLDEYKMKVTQLEERVKTERFKHLITAYEFQDFRSYVGTLLPQAIKEKGEGEKSYPLRTLASVVQKSVNENLAQARAKGVMDEGKKLFREQKYAKAVDQFEVLLKKHPYSPFIPEALLLLVESHFVLGNYDQVTFYANKMLDVYPESELTGYALIRLGKVYELQDRHSDAIDIYKTVLLSFPDRGLASVAQSSLRSVEL